MWSVGCITGLIFLVNISAGMHMGVKKDHILHDIQFHNDEVIQDQRHQLQLQAQEIEPECHHHVQDVNKIYYTYLGEPSSEVRKRHINQKMRMHVYYDPDTIPSLSTALKDVIQNIFIKKAVEYFKKTLKVRSVKTPIKLFRPCNNWSVTYIGNNPIPYCTRGCTASPMCGIVKIPAEHLTGCYEMVGGQGWKEGNDGAGVNTDFILYVSAKLTSTCGPQSIAYASHCQLEQALDRPVAGYVNFCPQSSALGKAVHLRHGAIATVKHEIIHALGFSDSLYAFFRDKDGNPTTARGANGYPPVIAGKSKWSSNITQQFDRPGWKKVTMIVTPSVVREVRRHFGCDSLEGAELEDQGGSGTQGAHWEKRVFENEALTGTLTQNPVLSRVTLALLQDTGWYNVNYKMAEALLFGSGKGCDFVKKSCKEYMQMKKNAGLSVSPYCDIVGVDHEDKFSCLPEWNAVAFCNLRKYTSVIDAKFQPFTSIDGVNASEVPFYGGSTAMADYCPFWRKYDATTAANKTGDSQCNIPENQIADETNYLRQMFSTDSVCFKHKEKWTLQRDPTRPGIQYSKAGGGCYKKKCGTAEADGFKVYVDANEYECKTTWQEVAVQTQRTYLHSGTLICPPYNIVCKELTAPQFPGDDAAWHAPPPSTTAGPGAEPEPEATSTATSGVSAHCVNWATAVYAVLMQMTLSSYVAILL